MKLLTPVEIKSLGHLISFADRGLVIGSCFAGVVGQRLTERRFNVMVNPLGVLYNPLSIFQSLHSLRDGREYTSEDIFFHNELWHSFAHHGSFSSHDTGEILRKINIPPIDTPDYIIITLGTAWVYEYQGQVVSNCHKLPAGQFTRRRLSFYEILETLNRIADLFPEAVKVFTVSPIRHIKDGLAENAFSKALLRAAVGTAVEQCDKCYYFPSFEIMMDELRDYRFYAVDMVHPTCQAADYIWQQFLQYCCDAQTLQYVEGMDKILHSVGHRTIHEKSEGYRRFKQSVVNQINSFTDRYKGVDLSDILAKFAQ